MASIEKRPLKKGSHWRVAIRKKGFPTICKSFKTEEEARSYAAQTEQAMDQSLKKVTLPRLPLKVWLHRYQEEVGPTRLNWNKELKYILFWDEKLGSEIALDISPINIESHADEILKTIGKNGTLLSFETRRKYLLMLSSIYTTAIKQWKWAVYNPLTGVDMLRRKDREKNNLLKQIVPGFDEFRTKFVAMVDKKMQDEKLSQRDAARMCALTLHSFQYAINPKNNMTLINFVKICNGFGFKLDVE